MIHERTQEEEGYRRADKERLESDELASFVAYAHGASPHGIMMRPWYQTTGERTPCTSLPRRCVSPSSCGPFRIDRFHAFASVRRAMHPENMQRTATS